MKNEVDVMERIRERLESEGYDALTEAERYYFAICWLEAETNNGAFHQYFHNSSGEHAHEALAGLRDVGAHRMAEIFQDAINLFPNGQVPTDRWERNRVLNEFVPQQEQQLELLSNAFQDYPDDLTSLLRSYAQANSEQFLGPTTLLEQWEARRARGASTVPQRVSEWDLEKEAAKDARSTDRKCPSCGQPAPNYRKTCKRCGYPYGQVRTNSSTPT